MRDKIGDWLFVTFYALTIIRLADDCMSIKLEVTESWSPVMSLVYIALCPRTYSNTIL